MKNQKHIWLSKWSNPVAVVGLIVFFIAMLLPAVEQAHEAVRRTGSKNKLKQLGLAFYNDESVHQMLPPGGVVTLRTNRFMDG